MMWHTILHEHAVNILTRDGIYAMRFIPSATLGSWSWSTKKISDVIIPSHKYIAGDGNSVYLFDGEFSGCGTCKMSRNTTLRARS